MRRRQGFTLVELLVVIGIIALLISILLPSLNKARQAANKTACLSNLHNMAVSLTGYLSTFKGGLPPGVDYSRQVTWWSLLAQQMGNHYQAVQNLGATTPATILTGNDSNPSQIAANMAMAAGDNRLGVFRDKDAIDTNPHSVINYSCHPLLMPDIYLSYPAGFLETSLQNTLRRPYNVTRIPNPADLVLIFDGSQSISADLTATGTVPVAAGDASACAYNLDNNRIGNTAATNPGVTYLLTNSGVNLGASIDAGPNVDSPNDPVAANDPLRKWANIRWRHSGNKVANCLFVDGHAASFTYKPAVGTGTATSDLLRRNVYVPQP